MKGLDNQNYLIGYIISNAAAFIMLVVVWKKPWMARVFFIALFVWSCWINWKTAIQSTQVYLEYADLAVSNWYKQFINGWFRHNIILTVGFIATCQVLIAIALLLRGWIFKMGVIGGVIFLLAITPLGVGAGFPATLIMAAAMSLLFQDHRNYLWESMQPTRRHKAVEPKVKLPVNTFNN